MQKLAEVDIKAQLAENIVQNTELSLNLSHNIVITTEDKVRLAVHTHLAAVEQRRAWVAPGGIFLTIVATFVTATFKEAWLPAAAWQAVFFLTGLISFGWLILTIRDAFKAKTIDDFVKALRVPEKPPA